MFDHGAMAHINRYTLAVLLTLGAPTTAACGDLRPADAPAEAARTALFRGALRVEGLRTSPGHIELPYVYYRRGPKPRPTIFFLSGGPGISNLKFTPPEEWLQEFDVVLLEYRGVGESSLVLRSKHFARALTRPLPSLRLHDAQAMQDDLRAGFAELREQGVHFDEFTVSQLVDDLDRLRKQLGLDQIYLVAHSFGTRVALLYQTRYRTQTGGSVLFSMNTPGGFLWYPANTQSVWARYRDSLATKDPRYHASLDRLLADPSAPDSHFGPFGIRDSKATVVAFFLSFNASTRDRALRALASAKQGSTGNWFLLSLAYDWVIHFSFNWADFFVKGYTSDCDREAILDVDRQGESAIFQSPSAVLFSGADAFEAAGGRCEPYRFEPNYERTLAIVGEFDPSTPIERRPAQLPPERFVVIPNAGHADVLYDAPGSTAPILSRFLLHGGSHPAPAD